jgi:hypothetical protein
MNGLKPSAGKCFCSYGPAHAARLRIESIARLICAIDVSDSRRNLLVNARLIYVCSAKHIFTLSQRISVVALILNALPGRPALAADDIGVPIPCEAIDSVGTAKMSADGAITLRLHTLWPQPYSESEHVYAPRDPHYGFIKRHLGDIAPGQTKPVPPLCGTNSEP